MSQPPGPAPTLRGHEPAASADTPPVPASSPTGSMRPAHLVAWLALGNLLLLALFIGLSLLSLQWSLQSQVARTDVATTNLARTLQQNIGSTIDKLDLALSLAAHAYEARIQQGPADEAEINTLLMRYQRLLGEGEGLRIADAQGQVRMGAGMPLPHAVNVADRAYFAQARRALDGRLVISEPLQSRISGRWVIVLARRLSLPDGGFAGIVYTSLSSDHFERLFSTLDIGEHGALSLRTATMRLVARRTAHGNSPGALGGISVSDEFRHALAVSPQGGNFTAPNTLDNVERINHFERVGSHPLYVVVGLGTADQLEAWRVQRIHLSLYLLVVTLLMAGCSVLIYRGWRRELRSQQAIVQEHAARLVAEQQAKALGERVSEREEFVRILAHEVRQPLNNASAALQGARAALAERSMPSAHQAAPAPDAPAGAADAVLRAQSVIGQIVASLNNTLAATALLASPDRIECRDTDVDTLIELSLGDLDPQARPRVRVERLSATRTASMDMSLVRLALRNLLGNALAYAPPHSEVVLRVSDSDEPLALVLEVLDQGPGVPPALRPHLFDRGTRGDSLVPGHGLGLFIVQRVMALHGGQVDLRPHNPQGSIFRLWLPQDG